MKEWGAFFKSSVALCAGKIFYAMGRRGSASYSGLSALAAIFRLRPTGLRSSRLRTGQHCYCRGLQQTYAFLLYQRGQVFYILDRLSCFLVPCRQNIPACRSIFYLMFYHIVLRITGDLAAWRSDRSQYGLTPFLVCLGCHLPSSSQHTLPPP